MRKVMRVILSMVIAVTMVATSMPMNAFAEEQTTLENQVQMEVQSEDVQEDVSSESNLDEWESEDTVESSEVVDTEETSCEDAESSTMITEEETEEISSEEVDSEERETEETTSEAIETEEKQSEDLQAKFISSAGNANDEISLVETIDLSNEMDMSLAEVAYPNKKVLLIQDTIPWNRNNSGTDPNQIVLQSLAAYDVTTTTKFPNMDISNYAVIIFANDQAIGSYTNYSRFMDKMQEFAESGGIIVFGAADGGWANGTLSAALPGGVTKTSRYVYQNKVANDTHPIVTGQFTDQAKLTDELLYSNYCSHVYFNESTFPKNTRVILVTDTGYPTLIEYPLGRGRVIASGLTWEHNYVYGSANSTYKPFAKTALDDLYSYALHISGIVNENIDIMLENTIQADEHVVMLADSNTNLPIQGAKVTLGKNTVSTDENGCAWFKNIKPGFNEIVIKANNYQTRVGGYTVSGGDSRYFFLTQKKGSNIYVSGAKVKVEYTKTENKQQKTITEYYDLLDKTTVNIVKDRKYTVTLSGEWNNNPVGKFILTDGEKKAYSKNGIFVFEQGKCSNDQGEKIEFNAGQLKAKLLTNNGAYSDEVELMLYARKGSEGSLLPENDGIFSIGDGFSFTIPEECPIIGDMDFNLGLGELPVKMAMTDDEVYISIGVDFTKESFKKNNDKNVYEENKKGIKELWEDYKQKYDSVDKTKRLAEMNKAFGVKSGHFTLKKGWDEPSLEVVGYAKAKYDKETGLISSITGELTVSTELKYTHSQQFVVGPVPVYFEIGGGVALQGNAAIKDVVTDEGRLVLEAGFQVKPGFTIGGGVGINGALSAGAEGAVDLPIDLFKYENGSMYANVELAGSMSLKASALFIFSAEKKIAEGTWQILRYYYDTGEMEFFENEDLKAMAAETDLTDVGSFSLMNRSYLNGDTSWYTENMNAAEMQDGMTVLQSSIMPTSAPQMIVLPDGRALMVFQQDISSRSTFNRSCLMYSLYQNGIWSIPKAVWDNGTADMTASLSAGADGIYVVWQKAKEKLPDTTQIEDMAAACEIAVARFDDETGEFADAKYITNDNKLQMVPVVAAGTDCSYAFYVENESNELLGGGTNVVYAVNLKNGERKQLYRGTEYITSLTADMSSNHPKAAMILDADGDMNTTLDTEVYATEDAWNQEFSRITETDSAQLNAQYCDGRLFWYHVGDEAVYSYDGNNVTKVAGNGVSNNFRILSNGSKKALIWFGIRDDKKECIYAKVNHNGSWSEPVEIVTVSAGNKLLNIDGYLDEAGNWKLVATATDENDVTSLLYTGVTPYLKTTVTNLGYVERGVNEDTASLIMDFKNHSETDIDTLNVKFVDADGKTVYTRTVPYEIPAGVQKNILLEMDIPIQKSLSTYTVYVYPEGETDLEDNKGEITIGNTDIGITVNTTSNKTITYVTASIVNKSDIATDVAYSVMEEDPENGLVVDMVSIENLEPGMTRTFHYSFDAATIDFNGKAEKNYFFIVESEAAEANQTNNMAQVAIRNLFYTENGEKVVPTDILISASDPVSMGIEKNTTYAIVAEPYPIAALRWPLEYTSSDEKIVRVDESGVLHAVNPGKAVITVSALDTEISRDINVVVEPVKSRKFTIEMKELSNPTSSYQIGDIWQAQIKGNLSDGYISQDLFDYSVSDTDVMTVEETGKVTMLKTGNATLTATLKTDCTKKAVLKIKVDNRKADSISLNAVLNRTAVTSDIVRIKCNEAKNAVITLSPTAVSESGEALTEATFTYATDNKSVAVVDKEGKITLSGKAGMAVVTTKVVGQGASTDLTIVVADSFDPIVATDGSIKININSLTGSEFTILSQGGLRITSCDYYLYKKTAEEFTRSDDYTVQRKWNSNEDSKNYEGTYVITPRNISQTGESEYYVSLNCEDGKKHYVKLKVAAVSSFPNVKVNVKAINVFYHDARGNVIINSDEAISSVTMTEITDKKLLPGAFELKKENGNYYVAATSVLKNGIASGTGINKYNRKYRIQIKFSNYSKEVTKNITIPASCQMPTVKLSKTSFKYDANSTKYVLAHLSIKEVGEKAFQTDLTNVSMAGEMFSTSIIDRNNGIVELGINPVEKKTTTILYVTKNKWIAKVPVKVTITPNKLKVTTKSVVNVNAMTHETVKTALTASGQEVRLRNSLLVNDGMFRINSDYDGISVTATNSAESYTKSQYSYSLNLVTRDGVQIKDYQITIKVGKKLPIFKVEDKVMNLDVAVRGRSIYTKYSLDSDHCVLDLEETVVKVINSKTKKETADLSALCETNGIVEITGQQRNSGKYQVVIFPVVANNQGERLTLSPVTITVNAGTNTKVKATASKTTLDAVRREKESAKVSFTVTGNSSDISSISIKNGYSSYFEIMETDTMSQKPSATIVVKSGMDVKTGTYPLTFTVKLSDGSTRETVVNMKIVSSGIKIASASKLYMSRQMNTTSVCGELKVNSNSPAITSITQTGSNSKFTLTDDGNGKFSIRAFGRNVLKKGTYTVNCIVHFENEAVNSSGTKYNLKIVVK